MILFNQNQRDYLKQILKRTLLLSIVLTIAYGVFTWSMGMYSETEAARLQAITTFSPPSASFVPGTQQQVNLLIQAKDASTRLTGVKVTLKTEGVAEIVSFGEPRSMGLRKPAELRIIRENGDEERKTVGIIVVGSDLPRIIQLPLTIQGTTAGTGKILVDINKTTITGDTGDIVYDLTSAQEGIYTFAESQR